MITVEALSSVGTCIAFSDVLPATEVIADYAALTWIDWEPVTNFGDLGGVDEVSKVTPVCSGIVQKVHGPRDNGTQNLEALWDRDHPAQLLVRTAYDQRDRVAVRLTLSDGHILYYVGIITSASVTPGTASDSLMIKADLEITSPIIEV